MIRRGPYGVLRHRPGAPPIHKLKARWQCATTLSVSRSSSRIKFGSDLTGRRSGNRLRVPIPVAERPGTTLTICASWICMVQMGNN